MQTAEQKVQGAATGRAAVRMYPNNQLREQVRDIEDTMTAFTVAKRQFCKL